MPLMMGLTPPTQPTPYGAASQPPSAQPAAQTPQASVIAGALPWGAGAGNMFQGMGGNPATTLANLGNNYQNAYNSSLQQNQSNYNNILAGYQQTAQNQAAGQAATQAGYGQLSSDVLGGIAGIGSDQQALLGRQFQQQRGNALQGLVNSGLGNSTVTASVNRGIGLDEALAKNNLANSIAQTKAGYQSNIGLSGLGYQGQAVRDNSALAQNQLGWMNSVNAGYPDAGMYGQLAMQAGAAQQSALNRQQLDRLNGQNSDLGAQVRQAAVLGGSGGVSPSTGGRLPPSSINFGAGAMSPGIGTGGTPGVGTSGTSGALGASSVGQGGGGSMQYARSGAAGGGGDPGYEFDTSYYDQPGYEFDTSYFDQPSNDWGAGAAGGVGGAYDWGAGVGGGVTGAAYSGDASYGGAADSTYDPWSGAFGGAYASAFPSYDSYGGASTFGAGALGGGYNAGGYTYDDEGWY